MCFEKVRLRWEFVLAGYCYATGDSTVAERGSTKPYLLGGFEPGKSYLGGKDFYEDPKLARLIPETEGSEIKAGKLPLGLKNAFAYYVLVATTLRTQGKWARMLVHPSHKQNVHRAAYEILMLERQRLLGEIDEAIKTETYPKTFAEALQFVAGPMDWTVTPSALKEVLMEIDLLIFNSDSTTENELFDDKEQPLKKNQVLIGGNILGRGLRIPSLHVVYYTRVAKIPQFDTMWQHSRIFGYDRCRDLVRLFFDQKTQRLFQLMTESSYNLLKFIANYPREAATMKCPKKTIPTRRNVIPGKLFFSLTGGSNYFTKEIESYKQDHQKLDHELAPYSNAFIDVPNEFAAKLLNCIHKEPVLQLIADSILAEKVPVKLTCIRDKDIKDDYRIILSSDERKASKSFPANFVLTCCQLLATTNRKDKLWVIEVTLPEQFIFSRTMTEMIALSL